MVIVIVNYDNDNSNDDDDDDGDARGDLLLDFVLLLLRKVPHPVSVAVLFVHHVVLTTTTPYLSI